MQKKSNSREHAKIRGKNLNTPGKGGLMQKKSNSREHAKIRRKNVNSPGKGGLMQKKFDTLNMEGVILSGKINFEYLIHHLIMTFFPYRCPIVTSLLCQKTIVMPCRATLTLTAKRRPQLKRPSTSNWSKSDVLLYRRQTITTTSTIETW